MVRNIHLLVAAVLSLAMAGCTQLNSSRLELPDDREREDKQAVVAICPEFLPVCMHRPSDYEAGEFFGDDWAKLSDSQKLAKLPTMPAENWKKIQGELYNRPTRKGFRQLMALLDKELADRNQLVVLENPDDGVFVAYAHTSSGWKCFTNAGNWRDEYSPVAPAARTVDQNWMEGWIKRFRTARLPQVALCELNSTGFCLHVVGEKGVGWTCVLRDPMAYQMIRGFLPAQVPTELSKKVSQGLEGIWKDVADDSGRLKWKYTPRHLLLREDECEIYAQARNAYAAFAEELWDRAVSGPDFAVFGGKEKAFAALESLENVGGCAVGCAGTPGEFYLLSKAFTRHATREDILRMLKSSKAIVRAMGLTCAAFSKLPDRVPLMMAEFSDGDSFAQSPLGCSFETTTVSKWAYLMLLDPAYLDYACCVSPLVDSNLLALHCLMRDDLPMAQGSVGRDISEEADRGTLPMNLDAIRKLCPGCSDVQVLKALGRARYSVNIESFLVRCLTDRQLPAATRLAAASGLTRSPKDAAIKALSETEKEINKLAGDSWGSRLLRRAKARREVWEKLEPQDSIFGGSSGKPVLTEGVISKAVRSDMPLAPWEYARIRNDTSEIDLSAKLPTLGKEPEWDVFSDQVRGIACVLDSISPSHRQKIEQIIKTSKPQPLPPLPPDLTLQKK